MATSEVQHTALTLHDQLPVLQIVIPMLAAPLCVLIGQRHIEYRVDALNAFMLFLVSGVATLILPFASASIGAEVPEKSHTLLYSCFLLCLTGLMGVLITGDAFNVFVFLEISSLSTYVLVAQGAHKDKRALSAAYDYLIMGTIGATFLTAARSAPHSPSSSWAWA